MNPSSELLQSLPTVSAWGDRLCLYRGFWISSTELETLLLYQSKFPATDTDLLLVSTPKSGTTWMKALLFAITKRSQYATTDPNHPLLSTNPHDLVPFLGYAADGKKPNLSHSHSPRLLSTHNPCNMLSPSVMTTKCRIIYLSRDPKDVFVSFWHFFKEAMLWSDGSSYSTPLEEAFELFCRGVTPLGPIWDHALDYWNVSLKEPEKVLFIKYEDLKGDIVSQVKKIAEFAGYPFSGEEESKGVPEEIADMCSFKNLSNLQVNKNGDFGKRTMNEHAAFEIKNKHFFRKGQVGDWKNYITPSMRERLDRVTEEKFRGSGLKFD